MLRSARFLASACAVPTPFLLFDECEVSRALSYFERHLPGVRLFYAIKANPHPLLLDYFAKRGLSFDASSAQELNLLSEMRVPGSRIIFTNPIKSTACLSSLFSHEVHGQTFDNAVELEKIADFTRRHGDSKIPELYLRIRVKSQGVQIDLNKKFGCAPAEAPSLIKRASDLGLRPAGVAFHVGTQSYLACNFASALRSSMLIADTVRKTYGLDLSVINLGGGFPDPFLAREQGTDLDGLFSEIGTMCRDAVRAGFVLFAEPGRILVSSAGVLVASVIGLANRGGRRWLYLDDGIYGCYSGRRFDQRTYRFYPVASAQRSSPFSGERARFVVAGPTCDSLDVVDEHALLPADIAVGDYVCSPNLGAYSLATACNFNGFGVAMAAFVSKPQGSLRRTIRVLRPDEGIRKFTMGVPDPEPSTDSAKV
jgi:ornithine decarboxylase